VYFSLEVRVITDHSKFVKVTDGFFLKVSEIRDVTIDAEHGIVRTTLVTGEPGPVVRGSYVDPFLYAIGVGGKPPAL
jgi:hypothetical protein